MLSSEIKRVLLLFITVLFLMGMPVFADQEKININTANAEELCALKRVGMKYAARIVQYRKNIGEFQSPEEVMEVKGIGKKTYEANKDMIIVREEVVSAEKTE